jgi:hypothetical protein
MAIDLGQDDPATMEVLARAVSIVDNSVSVLHDELDTISYPGLEDSEVYRLARALPEGQISYDRTVLAAASAARGSLAQISWIIRNPAPTTPIVLHALLRSALIGSGRIVYSLLPTDPETRLTNARVLLAQETYEFVKTLDLFSEFSQLRLVVPDADYVARAKRQNREINQGRPKGDGQVMNGAAEQIATALQTRLPGPSEHNHDVLREHFIWLWNTYSGLAHAHAWPKLLPGSGQDRNIPGNFPGDFHMIATAAHIAMLTLKHRLQPQTANTTSPVPMTPQPPLDAS